MSFPALRRHWLSLAKKKLRATFPNSAATHRLTGAISFAAHDLDNIIRPFLSASPKWFVEAGANDGINQSNTKALELFDKWSGILIEPVPAVFAQLVKNRSKRNHFKNCALVSSSFDSNSVKMFVSNLMSTTVGLKSDIPDPEAHARSGARFLKNKEEVHLIDVPARTLDSILQECGAPRRMGLLSLDVEGAELEALGGLQLDYYRFDVILIETRSLEEVVAYLESYGYELHSELTGHDYLFVDRRANTLGFRAETLA